MAVAQLREAVRLDPHVAETRNLLGAALARRGDLPAAIAEFEMSVSIDRQHVDALGNLRQARELLQGKSASPTTPLNRP